MTKQRNYKDEYQQRLERAKEKGYSKSIARGHSRSYEYSLREAVRYNREPVNVAAGRTKRAGDSRIRDTGKDLSETDIDRVREALQREGANVTELDFHSESDVIKKLLDIGYTPREAYQLRFS